MTGGASATRRPGSAEVASLAERMGYLQALRMALAVIVLTAAVVASRVIGVGLADVMLVTASYLLLTAAAEGVRRMGRGRGLAVVAGMLLVDGIYLAWVMYSTGGTLSPFRFLFYVHLISVTLLASHRTGLKVAMWDSLLYFVVFYAEAAGYVEAREGVANALPGEGPLFTQLSFFNVMALWAVAGTTAVFSALNERELKRRKGDMEALATMASELEEAKQPEEIGEIVLNKLSESFGFKRGVVLASRDEEATLLAYCGPGEPSTHRPELDAVVQEAYRTHQTVLVKELEPDENRSLASLLPFARNLVVAPLFAEGQPVGVIVVEHPPKTRRIERRVVTMVNQFAAHAALALTGAWLLQQVQRLAETDALTGVANRRLFEETLSRELSRSVRTEEPLTLAMFDVDHFKKLNDTHGHQTGDEVLKAVAAALLEHSRDFDIVARYGGEEFAVILPGCSPRQALVVAERLRKGISETTVGPPITASAGVATYPAHASNAHSLIKAADEALYESKRSGRDRVTRSRRRPRRTLAPTT